MNLPRYSLNRKGELTPDPEGPVCPVEHADAVVSASNDEARKLFSMVAALVRDRCKGIVEITYESMNALVTDGKTLQVNTAADGQGMVLRVVDNPAVEPVEYKVKLKAGAE